MKKLFLVFTTLLLAITLANLATGMFALHRATETDMANLAVMGDVVSAVNIVRSAQAHFATQTREWNHALLRGYDSDEFHKHFGAFMESEKLVVANLNNAKSFAERFGAKATDIDSLLAEHKALGAKYRDAATHFDQMSPTGARQPDSLVKGAEQPFEEKLSALATRFYDEGERIGRELNFQSQEMCIKWLMVYTITATAGLVLAVSFILVMMRRMGE